MYASGHIRKTGRARPEERGHVIRGLHEHGLGRSVWLGNRVLMKAKAATRIRAVVRVRPLQPFERGHSATLLQISPPTSKQRGVVVLRNPSSKPRGLEHVDQTETVQEFPVDGVFGPTSTQQDVFDGCNVKSMVSAVVKGYK